MTSRVRGSYRLFEEPRGALLPIELAEVPFTTRRVFVVTGVEGGADRGDHPAPCGEEVVLISGSARFWICVSAGEVEELVLDRPGQRVVLRRGEHVRYRLADADSRILVLAEEPYKDVAP